MDFNLACVGLNTEQRYWVRMAVESLPRAGDRVHLVDLGVRRIHLLLVNAASVAATGQAAELRLRSPGLVEICVSDSGVLGRSRYRVQSRQLALGFAPVLQEVIQRELMAGDRVTPADARGGEVERVVGQPLQAIVVDDSQLALDQWSRALREVGVSVWATASAYEALWQVRRWRPGLLLVGSPLPGTDSYRLCRQVKCDPGIRDCQVYLFGQRNSALDRARRAVAGCDGFLRTPVDRRQLAELVAGCLAADLPHAPHAPA